MARRISRKPTETDRDLPDVPMVDVPKVSVPAKEMVNESGVVRDYGIMTGRRAIKPGGSCPIPKDPVHRQYLINHGFVLR